MPKPNFIDNRLGPAVDRDLLGKLVRNELPEPAARAAYRLITMFKKWSVAHDEVLAEEARRRGSSQ
ncbi:MAG TPA: hypothetical protein VHC22_12720 [Pirellulales bacterium]|nr:hypothetical protein [Pirellulales bacterium]